MSEKSMFVVLSAAGAQRDLAKGVREQAYWDEHVPFINSLIDSGFILMGGPFVDEGGAMLVVTAEGEAEVRATLEVDPWYRHEILRLDAIKRWEMYIDELPSHQPESA